MIETTRSLKGGADCSRWVCAGCDAKSRPAGKATVETDGEAPKGWTSAYEQQRTPTGRVARRFRGGRSLNYRCPDCSRDVGEHHATIMGLRVLQTICDLGGRNMEFPPELVEAMKQLRIDYPRALTHANISKLIVRLAEQDPLRKRPARRAST